MVRLVSKGGEGGKGGKGVAVICYSHKSGLGSGGFRWLPHMACWEVNRCQGLLVIAARDRLDYPMTQP